MLGRVPGIRAGNVVAFGVARRKGREGIVVVAETKERDVERLRREVAARVRAAVGVPAHDVVLVAPGTVPKTTSGKLQRSRCREDYLARLLVPVEA